MSAAISWTQATELRRLYGELPNAAAAARKALKVVGGESLTGDALQRFLRANSLLNEITSRIKAIVG